MISGFVRKATAGGWDGIVTTASHTKQIHQTMRISETLKTKKAEQTFSAALLIVLLLILPIWGVRRILLLHTRGSRRSASAPHISLRHILT
jgi:hypothetical protein